MAVPTVVALTLLTGLGAAVGTLATADDDPVAATTAVDAAPADPDPSPTVTSDVEADAGAPSVSPSAEPAAEPPPTKAPERRDRLADLKKKVTRQLAKAPPEPELPETVSFKIATYNILGSNHAPNGQRRAATSAGFIVDRGVDVVGLQEVQRDQQGVFEAGMPGYAFWPDGALGRQDYRKQIAWRTSMFEFVDGGAAYYTFTSMPGIPMPWVRLRHRATGAEFYVINNHNSARNLEGERDASTGVAIDLIRELRASGLPVFIVGDMNEHTEFFCRVAQATGMVAANGGSGDGGCSLPPPPLRVDWIMGVGASFSGYVQDGASIASGASDHYFLHADATIDVPR